MQFGAKYLANAIYGLCILLLRSLAENMANAIFGKYDFFQVPKDA